MNKLEYTPIVLNGNVLKRNKKFVIHAIRDGVIGGQRTFCLVDIIHDPYPMVGETVTCNRCLAAMKTQEKAIEAIEKMKENNLQK